MNINECAVNTFILTVCVVLGMMTGDITRGVYLEYSKYNIYVEIKNAVNESRKKRTIKKIVTKKKKTAEPSEPSIVSKRLFSILKEPFLNDPDMLIFDEQKDKPAPLIYKVLGLEWKGSEESRKISSEIERIQSLTEIINEIRKSNDQFLEKDDNDAVQEYLRKRVAELKKQEARAN
jgi:hypothetical protein